MRVVSSAKQQTMRKKKQYALPISGRGVVTANHFLSHAKVLRMFEASGQALIKAAARNE